MSAIAIPGLMNSNAHVLMLQNKPSLILKSLNANWFGRAEQESTRLQTNLSQPGDISIIFALPKAVST